MEQLQFNENSQEYSLYIDECIFKIKSCILNSIPSKLKNLTKNSTREQKIIITTFQDQLLAAFVDSINSITWTKEYKIGERRDSIDIYGKEKKGNYNIIIELDKPRADQVSKKIVSRIANYLNEPVVYFAICYPGTDKMNPNECIKYFEYGKKITSRINPQTKFIGCLIDNRLNVAFY